MMQQAHERMPQTVEHVAVLTVGADAVPGADG